MTSMTLDDIREAYRKLGPPTPSFKGSPYICAGEAYMVTYVDPLTKERGRVIVMNDEEMELLFKEGE